MKAKMIFLGIALATVLYIQFFVDLKAVLGGGETEKTVSEASLNPKEVLP